MAFISSIEKDSIVTTRGSFKDYVIACKIGNQIHTKFKKRNILQATSESFAQKWLFCKTYVLCNIFFFYLYPNP